MAKPVPARVYATNAARQSAYRQRRKEQILHQIQVVQGEGYITVGSKIDPNDWKKGQTAAEIVSGVMDQVEREATRGCETRAPLYCGNIILLHDGGGDRSQTFGPSPWTSRCQQSPYRCGTGTRTCRSTWNSP